MTMTNALPNDYIERVYAGVLGKLIGVYLGRPFEGWTYERITRELGDVWYYLHEHERFSRALVVTDDDISGTFTFVRALPDHDNSPDLSAEQIGASWLNYIIEDRTILWWGGIGNSTEHTAYARLKSGVPAPASGSIARNGAVIAQQIGAQIFIDGWALVSPGDPERAAALAQRAASVSHDGEAIYAAQVIAAIEALAFVERDLDALIDAAVRLIPRDSLVYRTIADVREWRTIYPDWRAAREQIAAHYGYDKYTGVCHVIPNHALIMLSLLYCADDFQRAQMIVNTSGWDTDCNAGNVGCIMGIKNGLAGIEAGPDWRTPIADRLYLPTADGARAITDAVRETYHLVNIGRALAGLEAVAPKAGAPFHFSLPGSVQGFQPAETHDTHGILTLANVQPPDHDARVLALRYHKLAPGRAARASTAVFIPPHALDLGGSYDLIASPRLYSGQTLHARLMTAATNPDPVQVRLYVNIYGADDQLVRSTSETLICPPASAHDLVWTLPDTGGDPLAEIGIEVCADVATSGTLYVDRVWWTGAPQITLRRPAHNGNMWARAWIDACDQFTTRWDESFRISSAQRGTLTQGADDWRDLSISAAITLETATLGGISARAGGLQRYYALVLIDGDRVALIRQHDATHLLAQAPFAWSHSREYALRLDVQGSRLTGYVDGQALVSADDATFTSGAAGYLVEGGTLMSDALSVAPL